MRKLPIFLFFFIFVIAIAGVILYMNQPEMESLEYPVKVEILNASEPVHLVGVKGKEVMNFGGLHEDQDANIKIMLNNSYDHNITVYPEAEGDVKDWLNYSDNPAIISPDSSINFTVFMHVPENTSIGNYTGCVYLKWES